MLEVFMPSSKGMSPLLAKYGDSFVRACEAHKGDEIDLGSFGELPPDIEGGVAQLVECKFDVYKKGDWEGEYFFYAAGVVVHPVEHTWFDKRTKKPMTQHIGGLRTSIMEPVCHTPSKGPFQRARETQDEHFVFVINELKKLIGKGAATEDLFSYESIEATAAMLREARPYFRFRTWRANPTDDQPDPRVNHMWSGVTGWDGEAAQGGDGGGVVDQTRAATMVPSPRVEAVVPTTARTLARPTPRNGPVTSSTSGGVAAPGPAGRLASVAPVKPRQAESGRVSPSVKSPVPQPSSESVTPDTFAASSGAGSIPDFDEFGDIDSLAVAADGGDDEAGRQLEVMAMAAGLPKVTIKAADNWVSVAQMIAQAGEGGSDASPRSVKGVAAPHSAGVSPASPASMRPDTTTAKAGVVHAASTHPDTEDEEAEDEWVPAVEEVYQFRPMNLRTRKPVAKGVECEVTAVDQKEKTADLRGLHGEHTVYRGVPWNSLEGID